MPLITTSAGLIAGLIASGLMSAGATAGMTAWNQKYNSEEAQKNRDFQKEMRDTSITSTVNQAKELGISPSLLLNQGSNAIGGSQASVGGAGTNPLANTVNSLMDYIKQDRQMDFMENMQTEKLDNMKEMQDQKLNHQVQSKMANTANKKPFITKEQAEKISENYFKAKQKGMNFM